MVEVQRNESEQRYEALVDGELAGAAYFSLREGIVEFTHTEVGDAWAGQGVGSALARGALDDVRRAGGRRVVPSCVFVKGWIDKHPGYQNLLAG